MTINEKETINIPLGEIYITPAARSSLLACDIETALRQHCRGDWGDVSDCAKVDNEISALSGYRVASAHYSTTNTSFHVITLGDRSKTYVKLATENLT